MRKIYTLFAFLCLGMGLFAQSTFTDDFEAYNVGDYIGQVSPNWTTWSGTTGGVEDAQVVTSQASSGTKSAYWFSNAPGGGPQDVILPFGGQHTTGTFHYEMKMYVSSGNGAYWNFQANTVPGQLWALECYMNESGTITLSNTSGTYLTTNYSHDQWFMIEVDINLNTNVWDFSIDGLSQGTFANPVNKVASIDIYGANPTGGGGNDMAEFWIDDVSYTHTPYVLPSVNAAVVALGGIDPATRAPGAVNGLVGQSKTVAATVRNLGVNAITSFDLGYSYNGGTGSASVTGVNIASLASQIVTFSAPVVLASGTNNLVVTVSNVNGAGADGDSNDDVGTRPVAITAVPAADKIVIVEEGTGTWCQWCPRGAIYMDYMAETYDGYVAGIAVHNGDPMTIANYDGPFSSFLSGYPGVLVERGSEIDPLDVEQEFLTKIVEVPTAALVNGATYDSQTRQLEVSVTYTFASAADNNWKVGCVLVEDSVNGTGTGWSQSNAYGNNAVGPMGGFENLGTSVPAAQMNYNHVARVITPNFSGYAGFPAVVNPSDVVTFNYSFTLDAGWDANQMKIVGILYDNFGEADNGSISTIAEAVSNGYVTGTTVVGVNRPVQPDALVSIFPNPTQGSAWLQLNLKADTDVRVVLRDVQGRNLGTQSYGTLNGGQRIPVNTNGFAKGLYFVEVHMGDVVKVERLVVE
jgi:hypothetical protein